MALWHNRKCGFRKRPMHYYDMQQAPNPRRVRIFMAEKGINLPTTQLDIAKGDTLAPEYLAVNPRGTVPCLVLDDGTRLDESLAICRYLDALHPEPNVFGRNPQEIGVIENWQRRCELEGIFAVAQVFRNVQPLFVNRVAVGTAPPLAQIAEVAEQGRVLVRHFFDILDARLGEAPYVAGERFTVADITAFVAVDFAKWVKMRIEERHSHIARWYAEISARPSAKA